MAETKIFPIKENFSMDNLLAKIAQDYQIKGYAIAVNDYGNGKMISISKNTDGIYNIIGMIEKVKIILSVNNGQLIVNFSEESWTDKIIAILLGGLCLGITYITGGIGIYKQYNLPKEIANEIQMYCIVN